MENSEFADLINQLQTLQGPELRRIERKSLQAVSGVITPALIEAAPEQAGVPEGILAPGELKASITPKIRIASDDQRAGGRNSYLVVRPVDKGTTASEYLGVQGPYSVAGWLENGHAGPKPQSKRTAPHPFVRPTVDRVAEKAIATYAETMETEVSRIIDHV
jgi:hypothetical protein